jgi:hypothetical protein
VKVKALVLMAATAAAMIVTLLLFWLFIASFQAFLDLPERTQRIATGFLVLLALTINIVGAYTWLMCRLTRRRSTQSSN